MGRGWHVWVINFLVYISVVTVMLEHKLLSLMVWCGVKISFDYEMTFGRWFLMRSVPKCFKYFYDSGYSLIGADSDKWNFKFYSFLSCLWVILYLDFHFDIIKIIIIEQWSVNKMKMFLTSKIWVKLWHGKLNSNVKLILLLL